MTANVLHSDGRAKDPAVERLIQKLEEVCDKIGGDESIAVMKCDTSSAVYVPMRIREIVQECLSPSKWDQLVTEEVFSRENDLLRRELERAQELVKQSQRDCQDLSSKFITVSAKIEEVVGLEQKVADLQHENRRLQRDGDALRQQLNQQEGTHSLHLQALQDGEERQAELVQTLQDKVLQYKDRCYGLEASLHDLKSVSDKDREDLVSVVRELEECVVSLQRDKQEEAEVHHEELKRALDRGEEHQQRSLQLAMANNNLRQQLEEAHAANSRLMEDVHQLTAGWKDTQQKLKDKESQWRESVELESGRSVRSHQLSLSLALKDAMATRNEFSHLKTAVQRELAITRSEFTLVTEQVCSRVQQVEGFHLAVKQRMAAGLEQKEMECARLTADLASLKLEYEALQTNYNLSMADLNQRLTETKSALHESEHTCRERSKVMELLEASNDELERNQTRLTSDLQDSRETASLLQTEVKVLKSALDNIIQVFTTSDEKDQEVSPKAFGTAGDVTRLKDWAVSVVRHGVEARDDTIQALQHELGTVRGVCQDQEQRLREKEGEIRAHTTASTAIKDDLDSCHANVQELTTARAELQQQLEEANSRKCEVERELAQSMARMDNLLTEKSRMEESNSSLQETIRSIRYDLEQLQQVKESQEVELTSRQNTTRKLEIQLTSVVEEVESLHARITELESVKLNLEKETSQWKLSMATLEMEKEGLQKELRGIRESEGSAVETLNELRVTNRELEAEKRRLTRSLQEVREVKARLDEENIALERIKMTNEEELQKLRSANAHLNEQVGQLDKSLGESEMSKVGMHNERGRLKQEVTDLSEALGKSKQALAEVQIQRGKLNNTIAKMAQEKGDLVREKIGLSAEVAKLQEALQLSEERLASLKVAKDRLEQKVQEVEKRLVLAELNQSSLEEANFMLQQEKHDLSIQNGQLGRKKEEELSQLQSEKDLELHQAIVRAKSQESDLQGELQQVKATSEQEMKDLEQAYTEKISSLTDRHSDIVSHLQGEIASLTKANRAEVERLTREKEVAVLHLEDEKAVLADRISKLQKLFDEKCDESHYQHQHSSHIATEQKVQLDASHQNGRRLESELNAAEQQLQALQAKVDQIRLEASDQVESLKNQLREASRTISQLEQSQDDAHLAIKQLEAKKDSLRHQCTESQKHLECALQEKEELRNDCQVLRQNLTTVERELVRSEETAASLQERLSRLENVQSSSQSNAITTQQTLARVEQLHAKLVSEHAALQATLTSTDKQNGSLQLELKAALEKASQLNNQKEDLARTLSSVENQLKVVSKTCELREEEISSYRQRASDLERERNELSLNLTKLQQCAHTQGQVDTTKQSELQAQLSELKSIRIALQDKVCLLETTLESTQRQCHDLDSKLSASQGQVTSLTSQLKHTDSSYKDIQAKHNQLLSVLEGTLGFADEMRESAPVEIHSPFNPKERSLDSSSHFSVSLAESGVGTSIVSPSYSLHSSMCITQAPEVLGRARTPSKLFRMKLDADSVREAILQFQKKLISAEKSKKDAMSSAVGFEKKIRNLKEEKASLQGRLQTLRSSLTSLQSSFDSVSKQRDSAEVTTKLQKGMIKDLERKGKEFEQKVKELKNQLEGETVRKQTSETKLKKYAQSQVGHEIEIRKLETRLRELELQKRLLGEDITRLQKDLQSTHATKDAEIERLRQKLATAHQTQQEADEELKSMKESMNDLDQSFKISKRKHREKIQQLELELAEAQCEKIKQEQKASDLQQHLDSSQRDNNVLEERLHLLTHGQLETTSQMRQLHGHIKGLERSVSHGEMVKAELSSHIQAVEMQLQEREGGSLKLESRLLELTREKQVLVTRLENLQSTLETATKSKTIAQDLCHSLENEIDRLRKDLQKLRDENTQLKVDLRESQFQTERLDVLVSSQQNQKVDLDHSLVSSSKENVELMRNVRELQTNQAVKDREQQRKLTEVRLEVERLHGIQKLRDAQWSGKEQSYKKTIQHLEEKVSLLEAQIQDIKHKKAKYIQEARGYEEAIQGLRLVLGTSVQQLASNGLDDPATIDQETSRLNQSALNLFDSPMKARRHYNPNRSLTSPTRSFLSPSGQFVPLTSTPTKGGYSQQLLSPHEHN